MTKLTVLRRVVARATDHRHDDPQIRAAERILLVGEVIEADSVQPHYCGYVDQLLGYTCLQEGLVDIGFANGDTIGPVPLDALEVNGAPAEWFTEHADLHGKACPQCARPLVSLSDHFGGGSHYWSLVCHSCWTWFYYDTHRFKLEPRKLEVES